MNIYGEKASDNMGHIPMISNGDVIVGLPKKAH